MMRKIALAAFLGLLLTGCVTNKVLSLEVDDIYFTNDDKMSEREMEEYLKSKTTTDVSDDED